MTPEEYTQQLKYLPDFMKDFHDQKDIFKAIHQLYQSNESLQKMPNGWIDNHIFTIDYFLWFMGQHGYKLQKIKSKSIKFYNLQETIDLQNGKRAANMIGVLKNAESNEKRD